MPKYTVKTPIRHDGEDYAPGEIIELAAKEAKDIPHAVEFLSSPAGNSGEDLTKLTKAQLVELAATKFNLTLDINLSKDELLAAVTKAREEAK